MCACVEAGFELRGAFQRGALRNLRPWTMIRFLQAPQLNPGALPIA